LLKAFLGLDRFFYLSLGFSWRKLSFDFGLLPLVWKGYFVQHFCVFRFIVEHFFAYIFNEKWATLDLITDFRFILVFRVRVAVAPRKSFFSLRINRPLCGRFRVIHNSGIEERLLPGGEVHAILIII